ncbi:DNA-binding response OmpR family regulator [Nocardioides sp. BE266]|uniref:response regulator transcription factor n=1 Tax=Nocardioides sp. BE266 TaxID=2817725 RepID=UPI00286366D5|nr:response regulator transcription factor [Nocardioides sp. BE266]MDR7253516.1 DNA-binding response OmpR family regulator [Nocardioides sp. BE266]
MDDEPRVLTFLTRFLTDEGHRVVTASNGRTALETLDVQAVNMMLLDLMMPRFGGLQVLDALRTRPATPPVIVLSAVSDVGARVQALDRGAVDFVGKPFHVAELTARVRRHIDVAAPVDRTDQRFLSAGGVTLDLDRRRAQVQERDVVLSAREFGLLAHLMRRRGDVCGRDELLHDVWGLDFDPGTNLVEVCVRRLRNKLMDPPIETVRGVGYCFYAQ